MFQMALLLLKENNCTKLFWNPCIYVGVVAGTSAIYVTFKCDIDLQPTWNVSNCTSLPHGDNYAKLFWNSCINVEVMTWTNPDWCMHARTLMHARTYTEKNCNSYVSLYCQWARRILYVVEHLSTSYFFNLIIWEKEVLSMHWNTCRPQCFFNIGGMF